MSEEHLRIYLNDHLAGSSAAIELLTELRKADGFEDWADRLRSEITQDREALERLMRDLNIARSTARQATAWLTEKLAELKTRLDDQSGGTLQRLELLEALALGIDGKRALWIALQTVALHVPALREMDYGRLVARAEEQRRVVEVRRLEAAAAALDCP
jgi:hypothetical protein